LKKVRQNTSLRMTDLEWQTPDKII